MKILTVTTLYPNQNNPKHGVFIETRLRHLKKHFPDAEIKVIAPVPWFPFTHSIFGEYATYANAPAHENRFGMDVYHPKYLVIPKVGMTLTPTTLAMSIYHQAKALINDGFDFDIIDGHYFYPDGVAIADVAAKLKKPFTVTARGTDINLIPQFSKPKKSIQSVIHRANHCMAVCEALRQELIALGAQPETTTTLRNGVDLELFSYVDIEKQQQLRSELQLPVDASIVMSVGHLIERKGHYLVIAALEQLPDVHLLIAGSGPEEKRLKKQVDAHRMQHRVTFLGSLSQEQLARYYGAVNALVLASSREGWANVLLEAMACGTPVVASNIWGTPEVVREPCAGLLVDREPEAIAKAVKQLLTHPPVRRATRDYAEQFDWLSTSEGQYRIFRNAIREHQENSAYQPLAQEADSTTRNSAKAQE